jgi:hypothetical protein
MELKLQYYTLSIRYHEHDNNYLEICRCYKAIYETATVADDAEKWQPVQFTSPCSLLAPENGSTGQKSVTTHRHVFRVPALPTSAMLVLALMQSQR